SATTSRRHIAITSMVDGRNVDWLEKVSEDQYRKWAESRARPQRNRCPQGRSSAGRDADRSFSGDDDALVLPKLRCVARLTRWPLRPSSQEHPRSGGRTGNRDFDTRPKPAPGNSRAVPLP